MMNKIYWRIVLFLALVTLTFIIGCPDPAGGSRGATQQSQPLPIVIHIRPSAHLQLNSIMTNSGQVYYPDIAHIFRAAGIVRYDEFYQTYVPNVQFVTDSQHIDASANINHFVVTSSEEAGVTPRTKVQIGNTGHNRSEIEVFSFRIHLAFNRANGWHVASVYGNQRVLQMITASIICHEIGHHLLDGRVSDHVTSTLNDVMSRSIVLIDLHSQVEVRERTQGILEGRLPIFNETHAYKIRVKLGYGP